MNSGHSLSRKVRFLIYASSIYALTFTGAWLTFYPASPHITPASALVRRSPPKENAALASSAPSAKLISGQPVRLVISEAGIDLPVDEGYYRAEDNSWTLSATHAQFAMMSAISNNVSGNTFIYGHGTDAVFGALGANTPAPDTEALVYTDNNHIFSYRFDSTRKLTPKDTFVLDSYTGSPILTLQTCTGSFSEWRSMFQFHFDKVVQ
jgi:LPXTG-site transpeptidase (sortase) family protein